MAVWRNGRRDGFKTHFLTECEFDSHHGYVKIFGMPMSLTEVDKTVGLIFSGVAMASLSAVVLLGMFFHYEWVAPAAIMVISWWFGASMTWVFDKHYQHYKCRGRCLDKD